MRSFDVMNALDNMQAVDFLERGDRKATTRKALCDGNLDRP